MQQDVPKHHSYRVGSYINTYSNQKNTSKCGLIIQQTFSLAGKVNVKLKIVYLHFY